MSHSISAFLWQYCTVLLFAVARVHAGARNVTVDDNDQSIDYSPPNAWSTTYPCNNSTNICNISLDKTQLREGTWHGTAYTPGQTAPSWSFTFSGTAVYVYGVVLKHPPPGGTFTLSTKLQVNLDGASSTPYNYNGNWHLSSGPVYQYNALVYQTTGLPSGSHTLVITPSNGDSSIILLDYIVYTTDSGDSAPSSSPEAVASTVSSESSTGSSATNSLSPVSPGSTSPPFNRAPSQSAQPISSSLMLQAVTTRTTQFTVTSVEIGHNMTTTIVSTGITTIRSVVSTSEPSASTLSGTSPGGLSASTVRSGSATPFGPIVGGTVGTVVALALLASGVYVYRARSKYRLAFVLEGNTEKDLEDRGSPEQPPTDGGGRPSASTPAPPLPRARTALPATRSTEAIHPSCIFPSPPDSPASSVHFSGYLQPSMDGRSAESLLDHTVYPKPPPVLTLASGSGNFIPRLLSQQPSPTSVVEVDTRDARLARLQAQVLRNSIHGVGRSSAEQPRCERGP
ncbi:hypothetical protein C8Q78DRAFT_658331 [Trametes maxima]|nr:hypothetical protein C8Q78DRAFT_658331 [Trametes maxima]